MAQSEQRWKAVTRRVNFQGRQCFEGGVRTFGAFGQTTHWIPKLRTSKALAFEDAERHIANMADRGGMAFTGKD